MSIALVVSRAGAEADVWPAWRRVRLTRSLRTVWDRLEVAFMAVGARARRLSPALMRAAASVTEAHLNSVKPST